MFSEILRAEFDHESLRHNNFISFSLVLKTKLVINESNHTDRVASIQDEFLTSNSLAETIIEALKNKE